LAITMKDGSYRMFLDIAKAVMEYWESTFSRINPVTVARDASGKPVPLRRSFGARPRRTRPSATTR
jgi:hypothetical protein